KSARSSKRIRKPRLQRSQSKSGSRRTRSVDYASRWQPAGTSRSPRRKNGMQNAAPAKLQSLRKRKQRNPRLKLPLSQKHQKRLKPNLQSPNSSTHYQRSALPRMRNRTLCLSPLKKERGG